MMELQFGETKKELLYCSQKQCQVFFPSALIQCILLNHQIALLNKHSGERQLIEWFCKNFFWNFLGEGRYAIALNFLACTTKSFQPIQTV